MAKFFDNRDIAATHTYCGTEFFKAPEVLPEELGGKYGPSVDLYSCGMTLLLCYFGYYTPQKKLAEDEKLWHRSWSIENVYQKSEPVDVVEKILNLTTTVETRSTLEAALESFWHVDAPTQEHIDDFALASGILYKHYGWEFLTH
jgi:serine/threonine protein kinase